ncbi:hypothetical protein CGZ80_16435 [Rhodopirellula sp. MGV]|nr:hypothetical protein CGZ80_16435 [Rhodopirellula sp. MGV]PNY35628.1 polyprenyl glycosylphosphotransferase [Rhodopirellula baltica]PNY37361.1 polyprenyl glycosylphosphotransferase [Rhodopirellula baltica]
MQYLHGLYPACGVSYASEFGSIIRTWMVGTAAVGFALALRHTLANYPWAAWVAFSGTLFFSLAAVRPFARRLFSGFDWWAQPVVIVGNGEDAKRLFTRLERSRHEGLRPAGIVFDPNRYLMFTIENSGDDASIGGSSGPNLTQLEKSEWKAEASQVAALRDESRSRFNPVARQLRERSRWLGSVNDLESILFRTGACRVAIADSSSDCLRNFRAFHGIPHVMLPMQANQHPTIRARLAEKDNAIELHCHTALTCPKALVAKRFVEMVLVLGTLPLWVPLLAAIGVVIKICDPGPIFYKQTRVGRFRIPFYALKFRSMVMDADKKLKKYLDENPEAMKEWEATHKLRKDPRVTKIGQFLRKTSLDELPQLWNVMMGEMSLVGPRPIVDSGDYDREYIQNYPEVFELYQMVRPGITGLWQVSGRNNTSYEARVFFDRFYLHNWSLSLDVFILWRTIKTALFREGAC